MSYNINGVNILENGPPAGSIMAYTGTNDPSNWLICNGRSLNVSTYNDLFTVIKYSFGGSGDNFNIPDYRGAFLRGTSTKPNSGYSGPELNASQHMGTMQHNHTITDPLHTHTNDAHTHTDSGHTHTDSGHSHSLTVDTNYDDAKDSAQTSLANMWVDHTDVDSYTDIGQANISTSYAAISSSTITIKSSITGVSVTSNSVSVGSNYSSEETRPYNYGVNWIIKY